MGVTCGGVFVHIIDRKTFEPVITGLAMVKTIIDLYPNDFKWKNPPYEYVFDRNPFDVIAGTDKMRNLIEYGNTVKDIKLSWQKDVEVFNKLREQYFLY